MDFHDSMKIFLVYYIDAMIRNPYHYSIVEGTNQNTDTLTIVLSFLGSALVQLSSRSWLRDLALDLQGHRSPSFRYQPFNSMINDSVCQARGFVEFSEFLQ
ncbi:hypothetical protein V6G44_001946 [Burkholderia multivorans]|uniref:hypothetical protein n=1 Tax=Burkholderia multivorans TaxID=87883 RepID=UPI0015911E35|nr:hypothetical protein [Burkholderia multivorans]MCA8505033.1 hypothetical protein [Burkholderia multivorans]MDN7400828.1 hypothetical protein [Burkholderia multivorans]MDN7403166.1 hypothetical protein [Burkholderia multivorans]MDN7418664.1 hypothetical protein [Burkholderia multivorans]MDN7477931.1 hypothetical protein [Burkholderia multivorans]